MSRPPGGDQRPPRLAELLLRLTITDHAAREGILGDLWEEYQEALAEHSTHAATRRYWRCAVAVAFRYAIERAQRASIGALVFKGGGLRPRRASILATVGEDIGGAFRTLRRHPSLSVVAVLTLGLGIGASTTIFSIFNAVVLRPLPFPDGDRLIRLEEMAPVGEPFAVSAPNFLDVRDQGRGVVDLAPARDLGVTILDGDEPTSVTATATSAALFRVLRVGPVHGRVFRPEEDRAGGNNAVALVSHRLWEGTFGSDPNIVGRTLHLTEGDRIIVGVMPPGFGFPGEVDLWVPLAPSSDARRDDHYIHVYGRLRAGTTVERANEEMRVIAARLAREYPASNQGWSIRIMALREWVVGPREEQTTLVLLTAVGLLLLLTCANVSNLLMALATTRQKEMGIRAAIGAGRPRVVRLLLAESFILALLGATAGIGLVTVVVPVIATLPEFVPRMAEVDVDGTVLGFAAVVSLAVGLVLGLAPTLHAARCNVPEALTERAGTSTAEARRIRDVLVVGEVALAMTLLVGAGLLTQSFLRLTGADRGFEADGLLSVSVVLPPGGAHQDAVSFYDEVLERTRALPGVRAAAATNTALFDLGARPHVTLGLDDQLDLNAFVLADWRGVTEDYFRTMGIPVVEGRAFEGEDGESLQEVVILNETLARLLWPDGAALGRKLRWARPGGALLTVVGVVGDVRDIHPRFVDVRSAYVPHRQSRWRSMTVLVRASGDPSLLGNAVRSVIRETDAGATISDVTSVERNLARVVWRDRFLMISLGIFATVATLLAALGIYGIVSFAVARRTHEIGIRMALGGHPGAIVAMLFRHGLAVLAMGIALGVAAALALARFLAALLFETSATDVSTHLAVGALLCAASVVAISFSARRATRIDPKKAFTTA